MSRANQTDTGKAVDRAGISLSDLAERLGEASANELFQRIDDEHRRGDRVLGVPVREARAAFRAARAPRHAQLVIPGGAPKNREGDVPDLTGGVVVIGIDDLEAVIKANQAEFDWRAEFAPRSDLPTATTPVAVRSGAPGRRMLRP